MSAKILILFGLKFFIIKMVKKEIRVIGIDDSPFDKFKDKSSLIVGIVMRGGSFVDGVLSARVDVDGDDSTSKIIGMINKSKFKPQLRCIFLDGIAVAGFNVIDIKELNKKTSIPVITIIRKMPDLKRIRGTLIRLGKKEKAGLIEKAGDVVCLNNIFAQLAGISLPSAGEIIKIASTRSQIPEPIRLSHLVASGIKLGESRGRA